MNLAGGPVVLGRAFTQSVELSEPFFKDPNGAASMNARKSYREVITRHANTGAYTLTATKTGATNRTKSFAATVNTPQEHGSLRSFPTGDTSSTTLTISNATARPFTISAVEMVLDVDGRVPS